jgi:putative transposase
MNRDLSATDYVSVRADGVHLRIGLEEAKAAALVLTGVRADGTKEAVRSSGAQQACVEFEPVGPVELER